MAIRAPVPPSAESCNSHGSDVFNHAGQPRAGQSSRVGDHGVEESPYVILVRSKRNGTRVDGEPHKHDALSRRLRVDHHELAPLLRSLSIVQAEECNDGALRGGHEGEVLALEHPLGELVEARFGQLWYFWKGRQQETLVECTGNQCTLQFAFLFPFASDVRNEPRESGEVGGRRRDARRNGVVDVREVRHAFERVVARQFPGSKEPNQPGFATLTPLLDPLARPQRRLLHRRTQECGAARPLEVLEEEHADGTLHGRREQQQLLELVAQKLDHCGLLHSLGILFLVVEALANRLRGQAEDASRLGDEPQELVRRGVLLLEEAEILGDLVHSRDRVLGSQDLGGMSVFVHAGIVNGEVGVEVLSALDRHSESFEHQAGDLLLQLCVRVVEQAAEQPDSASLAGHHVDRGLAELLPSQQRGEIRQELHVHGDPLAEAQAKDVELHEPRSGLSQALL
mmetsp:Transcript_18875/g.36470  ORF Transcript_18875/g.36470 Transcript_18875/m.36470 type:complete len:455 (+) Transcript_18875:1323-2687(+)